MESCNLTVADRVVVRADVGPLDAEYALVGPQCIELRTTAPGAVREAGYRTTVAEARERLARLGFTHEAAEAAAAAVRPAAAAYARGPVVRRAAAELGAAELFDGKVLLAAAHTYEGAWLDLAALTFDLGDPGTGAALQAFHLAALLGEMPDDAEVNLVTLPFTRHQKVGVRTFKRVALGDPLAWIAALQRFGERPPASVKAGVREAGPTRVEVLDLLRRRSVSAGDSTLDRFSRVERAMSAVSRPPPERGPLSDPAAWSVEALLDAGDATGALAQLSEMERESGPIASVVYLKSRAALMLKKEDPKVIAERVSMLAAKASFHELELLAAEAWAAAGNMGRALPYARVLAQDPQAHQELRGRALAVVEAARRVSAPPTPRPPAPENAPRQQGPARTDVGTSGVKMRVPETSSHPPSTQRSDAPRSPRAAADDRRDTPTPMPMVLQPSRMSSGPPAASGRIGDASSVVLEELEVDLPPAIATPRVASRAPAPFSSRPTPAERPRPGALPAEAIGVDQRKVPTLAPPPSPSPPTPPDAWGRSLARGASQPAFCSVSTNSTPPRLALGKVQYAENLADPPPPAVSDERMREAYEARVRCTELSRELGRLYRLQCGVELRTDVASIEAMQAQLIERYHAGGVRTSAAAEDVRRHGAFLSEILARTLRATWTDVRPSELGHWAMFVPPDTRVWPFARVLRLITMGFKERDLVSYYLELHARSY